VAKDGKATSAAQHDLLFIILGSLSVTFYQENILPLLLSSKNTAGRAGAANSGTTASGSCIVYVSVPGMAPAAGQSCAERCASPARAARCQSPVRRSQYFETF
jgi:hypothetical protein